MRISIRASLAAFMAVIMLVIACSPTDLNAASESNLEVTAEHGTVVDYNSGLEFTSGYVAGGITLVFTANPGYEFVNWSILGVCESQANGTTLQISDIQGKVKVMVETRNYSTSHELINIIDAEGTPRPGDTLVNAWNFNSTLLVREGDSWTGMPSTPMIVGDRVYVRAGGVLYSLDLHSGTIVDYVNSGGAVSFYHYLSYGNGVIFDHIGNRAYDLDLNLLYELPSNLNYSTYHDGFFYGLLSVDGGYKLFKTSLDVDKDLSSGVKTNLFTSNQVFKAWSQYGQHASIVFEGDYMFFVEADGRTGKVGYRAITAFNLQTEEYDTQILDGFTGMPWDDGWLSYYDGYFYLTAYVAGLFDGAIEGTAREYSSIMWVKFNFETGEFETPSYKDITTAPGKRFLGIASGLEIHDGRGYINVRYLAADTLGGSNDSGTCLIAYNIGENGEPIPQSHAGSVMTHGGIVVNTAYADEGKKYIYIIPYNAGSQGLYVFTDEYIDGEWQLNSKYTFLNLNTTMSEYSSQAIRVGSNGEIIYYPDHGYVQCFVADSRFQVTVTMLGEDYASVDAGCGLNAGKVLESMYAGSTIDGSTITIGGKNYTIYGLHQVYGSVKVLPNVYTDKYVGDRNLGNTEAYYTHIYLVEEGVTPVFNHTGDSGWYYFDGGEFKKCNLKSAKSLDGAIGKTMTFSDSMPEADSIFVDPFIQVKRGSSVNITLPSILDVTYTVEGEDVISVSKNGNVLKVVGVKEDNATISVMIDGQRYDVEVLVMPKVTVVGSNTITESVTSKPTEDGGRVDTTTVTTSNSKGYTQTQESRTYNQAGALVEVVNMTKTVQNAGIGELIVTDQYVQVEEVETKVSATVGGDPTTHTQYRKETMTKGQQDGTVRTEVIEATSDVLSQRLVLVTTVTISDFRFSHTVVTTEISEGGSVVGGGVDESVDSTDGNITVSKDGDDIIVEVNGDTNADIADMVEAMGGNGTNVDVIGGSNIPGNVLDSAAGIGATITMTDDIGTIILGPNALDALKGKGDMLFSVELADRSDMTLKQEQAAGDATVFSIDIWCDDVGQHDFGRFSVSIVCDITVQQDKVLKVWRIDEYGQKTYATDVSYSGGVLSFTSNHLSYYAVGYEADTPAPDNGGDNSMLLIGAGVAAVIVLIVAVVALRARRS